MADLEDDAAPQLIQWTGQVGDIRRALTLFQELLPDLVPNLGPHHPKTLTARHNIAHLAERVK